MTAKYVFDERVPMFRDLVVGESSPLVGREEETRLLDGVIDRIREQGGAMVVRGEAGIGKSALLSVASRAAAARGVRVLRTAGVESEAQIPFAGLYRLLRPVLDGVAELPEPQRDAILAAFGRSSAVVPDPHFVALATLNLLGDAASSAPVLLVVEDAHWLDRASAGGLVFVARRLEFEPIVLLAGLRDGFAGPLADGELPELPLRRLDRTAAATLLDVRAPDLAPSVRERVLDAAAGNPLALVELPISAGQAGAEVAATAWLPLTTRLEHAFAARVSGLPTATRLLLLVAALNDGDVLSEIVDAASHVAGERLGVDDLVPAVDGQLIYLDEERVSFRHPLMRTAIHQRSTIGQRHLVHGSLADVVGGDDDRRTWHRAASAARADEDIAAALDTAAVNAHRRGGMDAAVAALERAAALSVEPARRGERLLRAAELAFELGRPDVVVRLLGQAGGIDLPLRQRARIEWIRERFDDGIRDISAGPRPLTELATRAAADGEVGLALKVLWSAALRCFWTEPGQAARLEVVAAAQQLPIEPDDGRLLAILAFAAPIERGTVVIERLRRLPRRRAPRLADAAMLVGAFDLATGFCATAIGELRAQGKLGLLARCLAAQAWSAAHLGDLSVAIPSAEEAGRLARETMQPIMHATTRATEAMLAALRGDEDGAENLAAEAERVSAPAGARPVLATVQHVRGLVALGGGRYAEAYEHLCRMHDPADPAFHVALRCFAIGDLAEAAAYSARHDHVQDVLAGMEKLARVTSSPALHAGLRHARAVLADDSSAEELFAAALREDMPRWSYIRARTQLAYGGWLRRRRRPAESRAPLRAARNTFDALGVIPWSDRARQELRASGETSRHRMSDARDRLTPQELQIAQMVAEGLTNREVGQRLYLSHRTVSSHLHRIFPKLGISSRSELSAALRMTVM